jgi:hypothetical protein
MNIFSGILSSITNFFSDNSATTDATPIWTSSDDIGRADDVSASTSDAGGSTVHSDTSDVFSAWGTACPNQIASESGSLFASNSFTEVSYGSIDSGISSSSSFDSGSSFSSSFDS